MSETKINKCPSCNKAVETDYGWIDHKKKCIRNDDNYIYVHAERSPDYENPIKTASYEYDGKMLTVRCSRASNDEQTVHDEQTVRACEKDAKVIMEQIDRINLRVEFDLGSSNVGSGNARWFDLDVLLPEAVNEDMEEFFQVRDTLDFDEHFAKNLAKATPITNKQSLKETTVKIYTGIYSDSKKTALDIISEAWDEAELLAERQQLKNIRFTRHHAFEGDYTESQEDVEARIVRLTNYELGNLAYKIIKDKETRKKKLAQLEKLKEEFNEA